MHHWDTKNNWNVYRWQAQGGTSHSKRRENTQHHLPIMLITMTQHLNPWHTTTSWGLKTQNIRSLYYIFWLARPFKSFVVFPIVNPRQNPTVYLKQDCAPSWARETLFKGVLKLSVSRAYTKAFWDHLIQAFSHNQNWHTESVRTTFNTYISIFVPSGNSSHINCTTTKLSEVGSGTQ